MDKLVAVFKWFFGCHHGQLSRVFTIDGQTYRVCCNCGAQFDYCLGNMTIETPASPFDGSLVEMFNGLLSVRTLESVVLTPDCHAKRRRARYRVGKHATLLAMLSKILPDRVLGAILLHIVGMPRKVRYRRRGRSTTTPQRLELLKLLAKLIPTHLFRHHIHTQNEFFDFPIL